MENEAQIRGEAGNVPPPPDGDLRHRTSVNVFFVGQLAHATDGFSNALKIGGGGFGSVYKAALLTGGAGAVVGTAYAAVKKLDASSMQGETEFLQEVQVLGGCRHENLLPLIGFSADQGVHHEHEHAGVCLVMPLMKGGSLEDRLFLDTSARRRLGRLSDVAGVAGAPVDVHEALTGIQRLSVLFGAVKGLEYLHAPHFQARNHAPRHQAEQHRSRYRLAHASCRSVSPSSPCCQRPHDTNDHFHFLWQILKICRR